MTTYLFKAAKPAHDSVRSGDIPKRIHKSFGPIERRTSRREGEGAVECQVAEEPFVSWVALTYAATVVARQVRRPISPVLPSVCLLFPVMAWYNGTAVPYAVTMRLPLKRATTGSWERGNS